MAKFKPANRKSKSVAPKGGLPCVILVIGGMIVVMIFLYWAMTSTTK